MSSKKVTRLITTKFAIKGKRLQDFYLFNKVTHDNSS